MRWRTCVASAPFAPRLSIANGTDFLHAWHIRHRTYHACASPPDPARGKLSVTAVHQYTVAAPLRRRGQCNGAGTMAGCDPVRLAAFADARAPRQARVDRVPHCHSGCLGADSQVVCGTRAGLHATAAAAAAGSVNTCGARPVWSLALRGLVRSVGQWWRGETGLQPHAAAVPHRLAPVGSHGAKQHRWSHTHTLPTGRQARLLFIHLDLEIVHVACDRIAHHVIL